MLFGATYLVNFVLILVTSTYYFHLYFIHSAWHLQYAYSMSNIVFWTHWEIQRSKTQMFTSRSFLECLPTQITIFCWKAINILLPVLTDIPGAIQKNYLRFSSMIYMLSTGNTKHTHQREMMMIDANTETWACWKTG